MDAIFSFFTRDKSDEGDAEHERRENKRHSNTSNAQGCNAVTDEVCESARLRPRPKTISQKVRHRHGEIAEVADFNTMLVPRAEAMHPVGEGPPSAENLVSCSALDFEDLDVTHRRGPTPTAVAEAVAEQPLEQPLGRPTTGSLQTLPTPGRTEVPPERIRQISRAEPFAARADAHEPLPAANVARAEPFPHARFAPPQESLPAQLMRTAPGSSVRQAQPQAQPSPCWQSLPASEMEQLRGQHGQLRMQAQQRTRELQQQQQRGQLLQQQLQMQAHPPSFSQEAQRQSMQHEIQRHAMLQHNQPHQMQTARPPGEPVGYPTQPGQMGHCAARPPACMQTPVRYLNRF